MLMKKGLLTPFSDFIEMSDLMEFVGSGLILDFGLNLTNEYHHFHLKVKGLFWFTGFVTIVNFRLYSLSW